MNLQARIMIAYSALAVIILFALAYVLIATDLMADRLVRPNRTYAGFMLLAYSIYRSYRLWVQFKRLKDDEE
ncbi:MAG: hypothetical protein JST26_06935 [Bacteroidetes bacterium]|nr:hypothetical protein [Bacteroidota bacterium]